MRSETESFTRDWYYRIGLMTSGIELAVGSEPMAINWDYWLRRSSWTKEEAILLTCGLEPDEFHQVKQHENFESMCKPFTQLCHLIDQEHDAQPVEWLRKIYNEGYLDCVPKGVRDWLSQQIKQAQLKPQAEAVVNDGEGNHVEPEIITPNERELKQGLRDIWIKEGKPEMKMFFPDKLRKYINIEGSPITAVYTAGKEAGIEFKLSTGTTGHRLKKTISNYVSGFKKTS